MSLNLNKLIEILKAVNYCIRKAGELLWKSLSVFILMISLQCSAQSILPPEKESRELVNLEHFNYLFTEIKLADKTMGVLRIYSEYPDYHFETEPEEGFACVDDAARAIVLLSQQLSFYSDEKLIQKLKLLIEFVLHMQHHNGYFNNFIWSDLSINTQYKTSVAELNWWSLRALWSLQIAYDVFNNDAELTARIDRAVAKVVFNIKRDLSLVKHTTEIFNGLEIPTWLPDKYAADQAAIAMIALIPYYQRSKDKQVLKIIDDLAIGIIAMQKGDAEHYPYGMFLSWKNQWHSWGNNQAYALLLAGKLLNKQYYIDKALVEIDYFYPYLLAGNFAESIFIKQNNNIYQEINRTQFPQIAYGIRPMVYAAYEAFQITKQEKYKRMQDNLTRWFFADNIASKIIYNVDNGRSFDAIVSTSQLNKNSGAESTIEALLVMQKMNAVVKK